VTGPKVGALFAGYGGLELAVREVFPAASPAWLAEFDAAPSRILAQRFPGVPNLGDVTAVDWAAVEPVDIITGGSPCQDLSHAGKRAGMRAGTRSGLWASMCDAIETIRPRLVVWENVRGALSACASSETDRDLGTCPRCVDAGSGSGHAPNLRALGRVLGDLAELGFDAEWTTVRASDVGAPHQRERVFVLAWDASAGADPGWLDRRATADARGAVTDRVTLLPSPRTSDTNGAGVHGDGGLDLRTAVSLLPTPRATDGTKGGPNQRGSSGDLMLPSAVTLLPTPAAQEPGGTAEQYHARLAAHDGREATFLPLSMAVQEEARFGQYAPAIARWEAVLGRPAPAPTEPTGKGGAHRLSPRFVEWLMGLPDGWVTDTDTTRNEQLKALGNGVVPQQAAAAVRHLLGVRAAALAGQAVAS